MTQRYAIACTVLLLCIHAWSYSLTSFRNTFQKPSLVSRVKFSRQTLLRMVVTDRPDTDIMASPMTGFFTNSSPETKRVIPKNLSGKTKMKIVYVVLESQYQSALTKACTSINDGNEGVAVEAVGYLLEELRNPSVLEQFKADVADANIFIGSLIFIQELADKVCLSLLSHNLNRRSFLQ